MTVSLPLLQAWGIARIQSGDEILAEESSSMLPCLFLSPQEKYSCLLKCMDVQEMHGFCGQSQKKCPWLVQVCSGVNGNNVYPCQWPSCCGKHGHASQCQKVNHPKPGKDQNQHWISFTSNPPTFWFSVGNVTMKRSGVPLKETTTWMVFNQGDSIASP